MKLHIRFFITKRNSTVIISLFIIGLIFDSIIYNPDNYFTSINKTDENAYKNVKGIENYFPDNFDVSLDPSENYVSSNISNPSASFDFTDSHGNRLELSFFILISHNNSNNYWRGLLVAFCDIYLADSYEFREQHLIMQINNPQDATIHNAIPWGFPNVVEDTEIYISNDLLPDVNSNTMFSYTYYHHKGIENAALTDYNTKREEGGMEKWDIRYRANGNLPDGNDFQLVNTFLFIIFNNPTNIAISLDLTLQHFNLFPSSIKQDININLSVK